VRRQSLIKISNSFPSLICQPRHIPTTLRFDTFQWLTGFLVVLSLSPLPPPPEAPAAFTGCHGGIVTKMLSNGFHSPVGEVGSEGGGMGGLDGGRRGDTREAVGDCAVNTPSSRSLSYTTIVPSACDTRKRFGEDGTQRTAVQGEFDMRPCDTCLFHQALEIPTKLLPACLTVHIVTKTGL
jgi:hypothetical protein